MSGEEFLTYEVVGSALAEHIHRLARRLTEIAPDPDEIGPDDRPSAEAVEAFGELVVACAEFDRLAVEHISGSN